MLTGVERLVDLIGPAQAGLSRASLDEVQWAVHQADWERLAHTDGHFSVVARDGQTVRLARTIGLPLRYFVAKKFYGPFLVVGERIDQIYAWCRAEKIGWQFDPFYTRMVPAHFLVEIDQVGCPDPNPRYHRFFDPPIGQGTADTAVLGTAYARACCDALKVWLSVVPDGESIAVAFSGGIDSTSVLLLACQALQEMGRSPECLRAFTLDLGGGADAKQAESVAREIGLVEQWEAVRPEGSDLDMEEAIRVIEDYHPLDVECAAAGLALLGAVRYRYPDIRYLLDGDGGDENLKSYPLEDSDLTLSSVLKNPLLYHEGWGIDAIKHSLTHSGGLSRSYVRTCAPARRYGFTAFSPYTVRSVIAAALSIPFERLIAGSAERLYALKGEVVSAGVEAVTGVRMPVHPKRRFQDGAVGGFYRWRRISKAWCRQVFLRQWEERLNDVWDPEAERISGDALPVEFGLR